MTEEKKLHLDLDDLASDGYFYTKFDIGGVPMEPESKTSTESRFLPRQP